MAVICQVPQTRFHAGLQIGSSGPPVFVHGHAWDASYKARLLQHATTSISIDPVALPDKVPSDTITQSMDGTVSGRHHRPVITLYHDAHRDGAPPNPAPHIGRQVAHNDGPMRASLGESRPTQRNIDRFSRHVAHCCGQRRLPVRAHDMSIVRTDHRDRLS